MKAIAAVAIARRFSIEETMSAGLFVGGVIAVLSATGLVTWVARVTPKAVVKGIQMGAGLQLVVGAAGGLLQPLGWTSPGGDNLLWVLAAFVALLVTTTAAWGSGGGGKGSVPRLPYALGVFVMGLAVAFVAGAAPADEKSGGSGRVVSLPSLQLTIPTPTAFRTGALTAGLGQLPLTTLNSIIAVCALARDLYPPSRSAQHSSPPALPSERALGLSVAMMNLFQCWFGAMPTCHGSGGLAAQYRFGARSGSSVVMLGLIKVVLGLVFDEAAVVGVLKAFPKGLLGVMVAAAGVQLAGVAETVGDLGEDEEEEEEDMDEQEAGRADSGDAAPGSATINNTLAIDRANAGDPDALPLHKPRQRASRTRRRAERTQRFTVMLITVGGLLAFRNDAVGFFAGLACHAAFKAPDWMEQWRTGGRSRGIWANERRKRQGRGDDESEAEEEEGGEGQRLVDV